jgi:glycosyltransferase involved in cell wall biosynthesis
MPQLAALALRSTVPTSIVLEEDLASTVSWGTAGMTSSKARIVQTLESRKIRHLYRQLGERMRFVVAISEHEKEIFSADIPPERITVIPHGVDLVEFSPLNSSTVAYDAAVFGTVDDGARELVIAACRESYVLEPGLRWAFVGGNSEDLRAELADTRAVVTGRVANLRPHYAAAAAVVVPSTKAVGVKTTLLQAWAMGRPVIATSRALVGLPARDGENVLIADSPRDMANAVVRLRNQHSLRARLSQGARQTSQQFDLRVGGEDFAKLCLAHVRVRGDV